MATTIQDLTGLPQGDLRLLDSQTAQHLLASTELARLAYVAADGTPRVFPIMFHWTGEELVFATFAGASKIRALQARPDVAVTIDTLAMPPQVLQLRGRVTVAEMDGVVPEYRLIHLRYGGPEHADAEIANIEQPGLRMARIVLRPDWAGVSDFTSRFPGGLTAEQFARRGQA
jgi:Pyridoxamine 5'-phosphate oxidase